MKSSAKASRPDFDAQYTGIICGIDEAGRGPLAGPVVAACVHIPASVRNLEFWAKVNDSKQVKASLRDELYSRIIEHTSYGIAEATRDEIDTLNIHHATLLAMKRAFDAMLAQSSLLPDEILVDGKFAPPKLPCRATPVIGGDGLSRSIAAASILAKVTRDRVMQELHNEYPAYGWNTNAGYGTEIHMNAIRLYGITIHHRQSYAPIREQMKTASVV